MRRVRTCGPGAADLAVVRRWPWPRARPGWPPALLRRWSGPPRAVGPPRHGPRRAWPGAGPSRRAAQAAAIENAATGALLWSRDLNTERPMASITKVMTALVVIRAGHLDRKITIPSAVVGYVREHDASSAGLRPGDRLTARQLL